MARRDARSGRTALRLLLFALAGVALFARRGRQPDDDPWDGVAVVPDEPAPAPPPREPVPAYAQARRPRSLGRFAAGFALVVCFFAGAALSAGAGDKAVLLLEDEGTETALEAEALPGDAAEPGVEQELEPAHGDAAPDEVEAPAPIRAGSARVPVSAPPAVAAPTLAVAKSATAKPRQGKAATKRRAARATERRPDSAEAAIPIPTVSGAMWLSHSLPVRTPPALQLSPAFAKRLTAAARRSHADWAVVFGVLRAKGATGDSPATAARLRTLSMQLATVRAEANSLSSALAIADDELAERAAALARYAKAVGLETLVGGLEEAGPDLAERVLADERVDMYAGGRVDVGLGRIDVRVLALIEYLAETYGQVTVSSLTSGHRLFSRPGVLSAHVFGLAVDIAALGGIPIAGNQEAGGLTEHAVRSILRLPAELWPKQVISLLGLGGPSFPLPDHGDHVHVGY